ncbi:hypothetical protein O7626_26420 [Micromonospora sp. WMMD1102]|uniref:hypothetical protein n=1 Tax=Micromonospora sp. WMMD1102 TaxID=3016105 RepID=UPI00241515CE|nr:hypothetical protein [Micromonospora sp. WMMD1102]MDG4789418.1 hypothetical protein [Micromonospora sp. WMMD1102]
MTNANLRPGGRFGAAAAAVLAAALALTAAPSPAQAAAQPRLQVTGAAQATIDATGTTIGFHLGNTGDAPATGLDAVYDASSTTGDVVLTVPAGSGQDCQLTGKTVRCRHGDLAPGQETMVQPIMLRGAPGARPGPAGSVRVSVSAQGPDDSTVSATYELPVRIQATGSGLTAEVDDLGSAQQRVGGGDRRPLHARVFNSGDSTVPGFRLTITLPQGATFAERYTDCTYGDDLPGEPADGYVYGPQRVTCPMQVILEPGNGVGFSDPVSGDAAFTVVFGKNLAGPAEETGRFEVDVLEQPLAEARRGAGTPDGPSLAERVGQLRTAAESRAGAGQPARGKPRAPERPGGNEPTTTPERPGQDEPTTTPDRQDDTDGPGPARPATAAQPHVAEFAVWTKSNSHDLEVRATAVTGSVGDTVEVPYTVTNHGPSDGAAGWRIVAPSGTVLLPSQWCAFQDEQGAAVAELTEVDCRTDDRWPATASGAGVVSTVVRVKIKSATVTGGTITVRGLGPSTESGPKSNTTQILVNEPGGGGGADDGLPITGVRTGPIAAIGAGALLLGTVLLLFGRRRRAAAPPPAE